MKKRKTISICMILLVTLLCGVPNSVWATGKIRSVDVYGSNGNHTFPNPDKALSAGETIYIRFRLVNLEWGQTSRDSSYVNPWQFYYTGTLTGDPEIDWSILMTVNVPRLGLWVGGRLCEAECVSPQRPELSDWLANILGGERHYTDLIFTYTIQPGDLALPIRLANASGTGPADGFGGPYYLKYDGEDVPVAIRDSKTQSVTADFSFGPSSLDMDPDFWNDDTSTWMWAQQYEIRDLDLSRAGVYVQAIDFDSKYFSSKTGIWRTIAQGSTTAKPSTPTLMIPGGAVTSMYYYVWAEDPNVAEIVTGGHVEEVRQYVFGDGMTRAVGKLHVNAGDTNAAFAVKATGEANQVTQMFLSATPTNLYDVAGNLVSNFIARTVRVSHPSGRLYASCTTDSGTYVENDSVKITVEISEPYGEDMYFYLLCDNPDVSKYFELGAAVVVTNGTVAQRRRGLLMQKGTTSQTYTLRTLDNTDYRGCAFTPVFCTSSTYDPEYRIEEYRGESVYVEIQNAAPAFRYLMPRIGYFRAVVGEPTEITYRVDDVRADLNEGMSVTMFTSDGGAQTKNNARASGTFTNVFYCVGLHMVTLMATDKDGGFDSVTINYRVSPSNEYDELIGDYIWTYTSETNDTAMVRAVTLLPSDAFGVPHGALEIPSSLGGWPVSAIDDGVFADSLITSLYVPSSVKEIGAEAFAYCTNLVSVEFAEGVERLGAFAFRNCDALCSLRIPASVKSIGIGAFGYSGNLENVIMLGECPLTPEDSAIYDGCPTSLVTRITSRWAGPMDEWQQRPVRLDGIVAQTAGSEEVIVGVQWITDVLGVPEGSYSSNPTLVTNLLNGIAANGTRTIAECYALGIDPDDPSDDLTITDFKMEGGKPVITLNHTKDGSGNSFMSRVKTLGKSNLADTEWLTVPTDGNPAFRFFKVVVEVP